MVLIEDKMFNRIGRSTACKICGEPYMDNIDPAVDLEKGGYVICASGYLRQIGKLFRIYAVEEKNLGKDD